MALRGNKMNLVITGRSRAAKWFSTPRLSKQITHAVSIGERNGHLDKPNKGNPYGFSDLRCPKVRLEFADINATQLDRSDWGFHREPLYGPRHGDIQNLLDWSKNIDLDQEGTLFIHCYVGRCRSTAAAYIIYASKWGESRASEAIEKVFRTQASFQRYGFADPNERMIHLASEILGWDLYQALDEFEDLFNEPDGPWEDFRSRHAKGMSISGKPR